MYRHRFCSVALLAAMLAIVGCDVVAMDFTILRHGNTIAINATGGVRPGDIAKLSTLLKTNPKPTTIRLTSPGGNLVEALRMGELIRAEMLGTFVPAGATCASACVHLLASGIIREVGSGAKVVVHNASAINSEAYIRDLRAILTNREFNLDTRIRYITLLSERSSAQVMSLQANYFQKMGVSLRVLFPISSTLFIDGRELTLAEMRDTNLINAD